MGRVYKVRQPELERTVALKILNPEVSSRQAFGRFSREAAILDRLRHPNIVRLFTMGRVGNRTYFTMDYVEGRSLEELIREAEGPEDRERLVRIVTQVACAVHYAHEQGVMHRDLKPSNVMVAEDGTPYITDFDLAREVDAQFTLTMPGRAVGTAAYISPEQAEGDSDKIGPRSDVYGLGAMLYEVLTGRPPFEGDNAAAVLNAVCSEQVTPPRELDRSIPRGLETVCLKCLHKAPDNRYATAEALSRDLESWLRGERVAAKRGGQGARWAIMAGAAVIFILFAGLVGVLLATQESSPEPGSLREPATDEHTDREAKVQTVLEEPPKLDESDRQQQGGDRGGVVRVDLATARARITSYHDPNDVLCIAASEQEVWWGIHGGAYRLRLASGQKSFHPLEAQVEAVAPGQDGAWYFQLLETEAGPEDRMARSGNVLLRFDGTGWQELPVSSSPRGLEKELQMRDARGRAWSADEKGLVVREGSRTRTFVAGEDFPGGTVRDMAADPRGSVWLATARGVCCFENDRWKSYREEAGMPCSAMQFVAVSRDGMKWFGTNKGLVKFDGRSWEHYTRQDGLPCEVINSIAFDRRGGVWCGGHDWPPEEGGLARFDGTKWQKLTPAEHPGLKTVESLAVDGDDVLWVGTRQGLFRYDGRLWRSYTTRDGLPDPVVELIAIDSRDRCWLATPSGLCVLNGETFQLPEPTRGKSVLEVTFGPDGELWAGLWSGGLYCRREGTWRHYTATDGLASNVVTGLAVDRAARVWAGCVGGGLSCFDGEVWRNWTTTDFLAGKADIASIAVDLDGSLWVGTDAGVSRIVLKEGR